MKNTTTYTIQKTTAREEYIYDKVTQRLIPFLFLCYVLAYLDRINIGFAKLQMLSDLKLSDTVYGLGAGLFFIGYFFFEIPSNILLSKIGARTWMARIMVTWGIISSCMMFVNSAGTFYVLRLLLGIAEAGFFPGIILYLTYWYPARRRARIVALFMSAVALSGVVGGPLSGWIMQSLAGKQGLSGWQWLFLIEGLPSVIVGFLVYIYLDDGIRAAHWLSEEEKQLLEQGIRHDAKDKHDLSLARTLTDRRVWVLSIIYFAFAMGLYGVGFWLPQLIKNTGIKDVLNVGLLTAIPYGVAAISMIGVARSSDSSGERRRPMVMAGILGGLGLIASALFGQNTVVAISALTLATAGILTAFPLFWTLPTAYLTGTGAAAGIAVINSVGNLAGFVSPYMLGLVKEATHSTAWGMGILAASLFIGAMLIMLAVPKSMT